MLTLEPSINTESMFEQIIIYTNDNLLIRYKQVFINTKSGYFDSQSHSLKTLNLTTIIEDSVMGFLEDILRHSL